MTNPDSLLWTPSPHPEWLNMMNREGSYLNLAAVVPLDEDSLLVHAQRATGLQDFGDDLWREPFSVLVTSLEQEAQLTLMGRLMARSDIILWLSTRLQVTDTLKKNPVILDEEIIAPTIIVGLPRSGTSILFELLSQDSDVGVPAHVGGSATLSASGVRDIHYRSAHRGSGQALYPVESRGT